MTTPPETATIVEAVLAGEIQRFALLVERYDRTVRAIAARALQDPEAVEEVVQQSFYLAFRGLGSLESAARFEPWLARIARNCATEQARRRRRLDVRPLPLDAAEAGERDAGWIWDEVASLPAPLRRVLRLRYLGGCSYQEIAERLSVPLSTVRGRIHEARRALRRRLTPLEEDDHD